MTRPTDVGREREKEGGSSPRHVTSLLFLSPPLEYTSSENVEESSTVLRSALAQTHLLFPQQPSRHTHTYGNPRTHASTTHTDRPSTPTNPAVSFCVLAPLTRVRALSVTLSPSSQVKGRGTEWIRNPRLAPPSCRPSPQTLANSAPKKQRRLALALCTQGSVCCTVYSTVQDYRCPLLCGTVQ